jgi:hypothetical protein
MSLLIYFFTKENTISDIEFKGFLTDYYQKKGNGKETVYAYKNPKTGAGFNLIRGRGLLGNFNFPDFLSAGVVAEIPYLKGTHFAVEALSEMTAFAGRFGLFSVSSDSEFKVPKVFAYEEYLRAWDKKNYQEIQKNQDGLNRDFFVLPQEKLLYSQRWKLEMDLIQQSITEEKFAGSVLDLGVLKPKLSEICVTATVLEEKGSVIPAVDYLVINVGASYKVVTMDDFSREMGNTLSFEMGEYGYRLFEPKGGEFSKFIQYPREITGFFRIPMEKVIDLEYFTLPE